jgi:hypothetical protein
MAERLAILFEKHIDGTIDKKEHIELMGLLLEPSLQEQVKALVEAAFDGRSDASISPVQQEILLQGIFEQATIAPVVDIQQQTMGDRSIDLVAGRAGLCVFYKQEREQANSTRCTG